MKREGLGTFEEQHCSTTPSIDSFPKEIVINYKVIGWCGEEITRGLLDIDLEITQILQNAYYCYCPLIRVGGGCVCL